LLFVFEETKLSKIKVGWINDPFGSYGRTPEQEIRDELGILQSELDYVLELVAWGHDISAVQDKKIDLLVFDYGGADMVGDLIWYHLKAVCEWALEHERVMVLMYSRMTGEMYHNMIHSESGSYLRSENVSLWRKSFRRSEILDIHNRVRAWFIGFEETSPGNMQVHTDLIAPGRGRRPPSVEEQPLTTSER
jgi:hypothetical protein